MPDDSRIGHELFHCSSGGVTTRGGGGQIDLSFAGRRARPYCPTTFDRGRELLLSLQTKRSVMSLGDLHGRMSEQQRDLIHRVAGQEEFHGECIPKHVGMAALGSSILVAKVGDLE